MGSLMSSAFLLTSLLALLFGCSSVLAQNLRQRDALCNTDGCFVVYFHRKTFLQSWKACKQKGGNLATIKRKVDATAIATLFSTVDLRHSRTTVQVWIGLLRQPRQCTTSHPLRGFSWTTGDQDTEYTDWQNPDSPDLCSVPRCIFMGYSTEDQDNNFKWIDSPCAVSADGYLCHYAYAGMCPPLWSEVEGTVIYTTPFNLLSPLLTHVPVGSVATVRCPSGTKEEKTVSCMTREDGSVGWTKESPLCSHFSISHNLCGQDNGGCEHFCMPDYGHFYCECADGYTLAPDERTCLDVDECLGSPCKQICVNAPGTFECQCHEGYDRNDEGECEDIDECINDSCEHACENTPGSHICHCHLGYSLVPEDPSRCQDINECEIPGTCEQMCVNYEGGFECYCSEGFELMSDNYSCEKREKGDDQYAVTPPFLWVTGQAGPLWDYDWNPEQRHTDWPTQEEESLDWLTESTTVSDVIWATSPPLEKLFSDSVLDPLTQGTDKDEEEAVERADWSNGGQRSQSELKVLSPTAYNTPHLLSSSATPDLYKEGEGEATTALPLYPTSTISEGAWNWGADLVTSSKIPQSSVTDMPKESSYHKEPEGETQRNLLRENFHFTEAELSKEEMNFVEFTPSQNLAFPTGLASSQPPPTEDKEGDDSPSETKGSTWLMVGLFIPICIFIVVMVALGFVYCNRYRVTAHDKNAADCYHWISGSHDKQGAPDPSAGVQSCV
ncbi:CD248 molecule, endosialin a [Oreochromis aureus]|uniref:CD248 molecule, endosialin a n=1 Tax=Oreochromis aureus TaxID=47969 RepID=A0AAZ1XAI8_OREAU|nr:CD248 molecule, endosialin a [Oreochromis aureus]